MAAHGTYRGYRLGCRKSCCRAANAEQARLRNERRRAANPPKRKQPVVPPPDFTGVPTRIVRYRYRLDIGTAVERKFVRTLGAARWVYNAAVEHLRTRDGDGRFLSTKGLTTKVITEPRKRPETAWLAEPSYAVLSASVQDARQAMENYWASRTGKRRGPRMGLPSFKKRGHRQSATFGRTRFSIAGGWSNTGSTGGRLRLEKLGTVHVRWSRPLPSEPSSATVIHEPDGTWWVSFVVEEALRPTTPQVPGRVAALDLGMNDLAVIAYSDGIRERVPSPRLYRQAEQQLASLQRDLSRRQSGSKNYDDARRKVAAAHRRISNLRENHARQLAARLLRENQTVAVETLSITGLTRTRMGKSVLDAGWGILLRALREGATLRGREIVELPAFFPGSRTCAVCGTISGPKPLNVRVWTCECGTHLDRDYNAAVNHLIAAIGERNPHLVGLASVELAPGLRERVNARGEAVSRPTTALAQGDGAGLCESGTDGHPRSTRCRARRRPHRHNRRIRARLAAARYEHARRNQNVAAHMSCEDPHGSPPITCRKTNDIREQPIPRD